MIGDKKEFGRYVLSPSSNFYREEFEDPPKGEERELYGCAIPNRWTSLKLIQKQAYNHDTSIFTFQLDDSDRRLGLRPGACLLARCPGVEHGGGDAIRPYTSISEDSRRGSFDVLIKRYDEWGERPEIQKKKAAENQYYIAHNNYKPPGAASNYIHNMKVGEFLRFKHSEACASRISLELLGLAEEDLFNEPNAHITRSRSHSLSRAGGSRGSRRPSDSKQTDNCAAGSAPMSPANSSTDKGSSTNSSTENAPPDPAEPLDSVFAKMMTFGTNPTALFNNSTVLSLGKTGKEQDGAVSPAVAPKITPLKDDDLFKASLKLAESQSTSSSVHVTSRTSMSAGGEAGTTSGEEKEEEMEALKREREVPGLETSHLQRERARERERAESMSLSHDVKEVPPSPPRSTPSPIPVDAGSGESKECLPLDIEDKYIISSNIARDGEARVPSAPMSPQPSSGGGGRPRPPSHRPSSFSSPRGGRVHRESFGSDSALGDSAGTSPSSSRVQTPSEGRRERTPPRVVEERDGESSPDPPLPPSGSDDNISSSGTSIDDSISNGPGNGSANGSIRSLMKKPRLSSGGTPLASAGGRRNWGDSVDARVEDLTLVAVGVGVSPMVRVLRAALELSTKLNVTFFLGVREVRDILMREMLEQLANTHTARFKLVYCVGSRYDKVHVGARTAEQYEPPPLPEGYAGLDQHEVNIHKKLGWIDHEAICQHAPPPSDRHRVVVCGLPGVYEKLCGSRFDQGNLPEDCVLARLGFAPHQVVKL